MTKGYAGKILWVDLSKGQLSTEDTTAYEEWIGGRALGAYILSTLPELYDEEPHKQPIVISSGPLVGSDIPMAVRTAVTARSQISKGFCYSNVGGNFGLYMREAGFDAVVVRGQSTEPVYLLLEKGRGEIVPAGDLWGKRITPFHETLQEKFGANKFSYIGIGPAGEKQAPIACLIVDKAHAAGWGGSGAIFGAKNLKALVALGGSPLEFFDPDGLQKKIADLRHRIITAPAMKNLMDGGTHLSAGAGGYNGKYSTSVRNAQDEFLTPEESAPIREENYKKWEKGRDGCLTCPIACLHDYEMDTDEYGKLTGLGMHANSVRGLSSNLGLDDPQALFAIHLVCNENSMDVDGVSAAMAFALECAERGILEKEQPGGVTLEWGNGPSLVKLACQLAEREGLGDLLCQGAYEAAQQIGKGSQQYAMTVKKVGINEAGLRSHRSWMLGYVTATRGAGHLGGSSQVENGRMPPEMLQELFGVSTLADVQSYEGKGKVVAWTEGLKAAVDSLGLCYFTYGWYDLNLVTLDEMAELYYLATGIEMSGEDLQKVGFRIHDLERYLSYKLGGYTRKDDTLPDRFFDGPVSKGPNKGARVDRDKLAAALDEYYTTLGWDVETGLPREATLQEEGLGHLLK